MPSLKLDIGLRYEYNQNVTDANNNMAIVNTLVPGGEFVIASNSQGQISPAASALLPLFRFPYVTSSQAGWDNSLLQARPLRLAPRIGLAWALAGPQDRDPFGIWNLYQSGGIQHHSKRRAESALLFRQNGEQCAACGRAPSFNTENILAATANGSISANNINHDFKIEYNNVWNLSVQRSLSSSTSFQAQYIGSYTVHADNETLPESLSGQWIDSRSGPWSRAPHSADERFPDASPGMAGKSIMR